MNEWEIVLMAGRAVQLADVRIPILALFLATPVGFVAGLLIGRWYWR